MSVRGQGVARAFDERLLLFSRQQTFGPSGAATRLDAGLTRHPGTVNRAVMPQPNSLKSEMTLILSHAVVGAPLDGVASVMPGER